MPEDNVLTSLPAGAKIIADGEPKVLKSLPTDTKILEVEAPKQDTAYVDFLKGQEGQNQFENIINNIPDLDDSKKEIIRDLAKKGVRGEELSNSILTLQGKHPRQNGSSAVLGMEVSNNSKYYIGDNGIPVPLKNNERPPVGYEVASIWGSQKDANDDAWYTDLAKTVYNVLPASAENVVDLAQTGYELVTDKESENLNSLKNAANYLKFAKDEDLNKSLFNTQGIDEWGDLLDTKRLDFSPESIWGTVNGLLGSIGEFYVGGRGATSVAKGALGVETLSKGSQIASNVVASTLTNLGEVRDAATEIGLTGRDRALFTTAVAPIISAVDVKWGLAPKIFGNTVAQEEKKAFLKALGKAIPRDEAGNITKEGVQELAKVTTAGYTQVAKKLGQLTATDVLQEGGQEALQQFIQNSGEQLWDKLSDKEKKKFGTDAFSPESFGEYISNGLAGLVGGAPTVFAYNKAKAVAKQETQANNAFELAKGGDEAINNFTANVDLAVKSGNMTKEEAGNALLKVATYKQYYDQTKDTKLNDDQKKQVFGLTFEKAMLENEIPTEYEENKLNAIEQAKISVKKKQAKDIQAELDKIFLADELLRKETTSAKKTVEEVDKHLSPEPKKEGTAPKFAGSLKELYEKHSEDLGSLDVNSVKKEKKVEEVETRALDEIPAVEWNDQNKTSYSKRFNMLVDHFVPKGKPVKSHVGTLSIEGNDTVHITLGNDKFAIFASSATDTKRGHRGNLHIENLPKDFVGHKVVIKPKQLTTGRTILPVYNAETGKHVGFVREQNTGKANEKWFMKRAEKMGADKATELADIEAEELGHLKTEPLTEQEIEYYKSKNISDEAKTTQKPVREPKQSVKETTPKAEKTQPKAEESVEIGSKEEFIADRIETLKADEGADFDPSLEAFYTKAFAEQYDKKNRPTTEGDTSTSEESTARDDKEIRGEGKEVSSKKLKSPRKGTKRAKQKITDPVRIKALAIESDKPYDIVEQYFIKNGSIKFGEIYKLFKGSRKESNKRFSLQNNNAPTLKGLADELWTAYSDLGFGDRYSSMDFYNAIEEVLNNFHSRTDMAMDLVERWKEKIDPREQALSDELSKAENQGVEDKTNDIITEGEKLGNDEITKIADDQDEFDIWGNKIQDIIRRDDIDDVNEVFQKQKEETEGLGRGISGSAKEGDSRGQAEARSLGIGSSESLERRHSERQREKQSIEEVVSVLQKAIPNVKIVYDDKLDAAGKWSPANKTITINPYHAGKDTPIHEVGHILIDLMGGMNNLVIRNAIKQLKGTALWKEVSEHEFYSKLTEEEIGYEVLAEAIGSEGAGIFDKEVEKNTFMKYLEYIYNRLKQLFGMDKEIAKSLAKQIIAGIGISKAGNGKSAYQKPQELAYAEGELKKAEKELKASKSAFDAKRKELGREINDDQEDLFGERKSEEGAGLFDERIDLNAYEDIITPFKQRYDLAVKEFTKWTNKVKELEDKEDSQTSLFQQPKKFKSFAEKTQAEQVRALTLSFDQYSEKVLKRNLIVESNELAKVNEALEDPEITEREQTVWESVKADLEARKKQDLREWYDYREDMKWAVTLYSDINDLEERAQSGEINQEQLIDGFIEIYNVLNGFNKTAREAVEANLMGKIAYGLFQQGKEVLKKNEKFVEEVANKADISVKDVWLKNLGHMTEKVPELQVFGKLFDEAAFDKVEEAKEKKHTFEKLGTAVIKEANKKLGIADKAASIFSSDSAKYFDYLDAGNGELLTLNEAEAKNLSDAQIAFLKYQRELIAEHKGMIIDDSVYNMPLQVLKTDPTFSESFKQAGINQAFSNYLGTNYNLKQVRIQFKDPETKATTTENFGDIEAKLIKYGKKGVKEKAHTLALLLKYNRSARVQLKKGVNVDEKENPLLVKNNSQFSIDNNGVLSSKFDKPRDKTRGYSKDFYRAGIEFIDDMQHVKHFSKLVPLVNSIEYLNKEGYEEHLQKPNVVKWINEWKDLHLFKNPKQTLPEVDVLLRFMRKLTSMTVMMFNVPAGVMNVAIGVYNNWRAENTAKIVIGHKRLFSAAVNKKAIDILRKYDAVSVDYDSNPKFSFGRIFDSIGYGLIRWGEFQIQGSMFLGLMTDEEYNSFEYKENKQGVKELVVKKELNGKPVDEKALKKKLIEYKKRVSDIQGKYGESDQRNITNNELGKSALQFKTYLPDAIKVRFGQRYIDANGKTVEGSWRSLVDEGFKELRGQIRSKGWKDVFLVKEEDKSEEAKNALANLKGIMALTFFAILANQGDDDEKRSKAAIDAENMLSQLMLIFNPQTLKFTVTRPIASLGTVEKFLDASQHLLDLDGKKLKNDLLRLTPANKALKIKEVFE